MRANNCFVHCAGSRFEWNVATDTDQRFEMNLCAKALTKDIVFAYPFLCTYFSHSYTILQHTLAHKYT